MRANHDQEGNLSVPVIIELTNSKFDQTVEVGSTWGYFHSVKVDTRTIRCPTCHLPSLSHGPTQVIWDT